MLTGWGEEMTKPARSARGQFGKREIVLFVLVMIGATALTIEGTYLLLKAFVLQDPKDLHNKADDLSPTQNGRRRQTQNERRFLSGVFIAGALNGFS